MTDPISRPFDAKTDWPFTDTDDYRAGFFAGMMAAARFAAKNGPWPECEAVAAHIRGAAEAWKESQ